MHLCVCVLRVYVCVTTFTLTAMHTCNESAVVHMHQKQLHKVESQMHSACICSRSMDFGVSKEQYEESNLQDESALVHYCFV